MLRNVLLALVVGSGLWGLGCSEKLSLPEPQSRPAQLYVQYCSASGCHGALPPQRDAWGIWQLQYPRMIALMRDQGFALPSAEEEAVILEYLERFARRAS